MNRIHPFFRRKEIVLLSVVFLCGIAFRLWFITVVPQPFIYDQGEYELYAIRMLDRGMLASHSYRPYPYSLFVASVYSVAGPFNRSAIFFVQAVLDSFIAVAIYLILAKGFGQKSEAKVGLFLYTVNPFTSAYVGLGLSEILTALFIVTTVLLGIRFIHKPHWVWGLVFGISSGIAAEIRNAALFWAIIPVGLILFWVSLRRYRVSYTAMFVGLLLPFLYPLYVNWRDFHEFSVTTVDNAIARELYNGAVQKRVPPFMPPPSDVLQMYREYYSELHPGRTQAERNAIARKYFDKTLEIVRGNPTEYIRNRLYKMWYVWQKENLFYYEEPGLANHWMYTFGANAALLALAVVGLVVSRPSAGVFLLELSRRRRIADWVWSLIVGTIVYGTVAFSFTHAEQRLTIPFYPLLILAGSLGLVSLWHAVSHVIARFR